MRTYRGDIILKASRWRYIDLKLTPYDYRGFSLKRIGEPRFRHCLLLLGWVVYFALYFITENLIPVEKCHVIHSALDDIIPFNEYFAVFYVGWYVLVFGSLLYTFFYDVENFKRIQIFIMITQGIAMIWYILYPSIQLLRPAAFERQNLFTWIMGLIYAFDTPTGVCPSLHVGYSLGILSAGLKDRKLSPVLKAALTVFVLMVCCSVCFVKQHSAVDVIAAIPVCLVAEIAIYWKAWWLPRLAKGKTEAGKILLKEN